MRRRAKIDRNHNEIADALRDCGCSVRSLASVGAGMPDLLVGSRGHNYLLEVKDGRLSPSKRKLTKEENMFHLTWGGNVAVVESVAEALEAVGL